MNSLQTRISKEFGAMFWPWWIVASLCTLPLLLSRYTGTPSSLFFAQTFGWMVLQVGLPYIAAIPLGREFRCGTLSLLLSQPVDRGRIWAEKMAAIIAGVLPIALIAYIDSISGVLDNYRRPLPAGLWLIVTIGSAVFWTLYARSMLGGFVLNLFSLFFVIEGSRALLTRALGRRASVETVIVVLAYTGLMLWLGRRKLARLELIGGIAGMDLQTSGPTLMPRFFAPWFRCRPSAPMLNFIRKELRLLRPVWLIVAFFVLAWVGLSITVWVAPQWADSFPHILSILLLTTCPVLTLILAGTLGLAEERLCGIHYWHKTLPFSALRQWLIKLLVAMAAGLTAGVLIPIVVVFASQSMLGWPNWDETLQRHLHQVLLAVPAFWLLTLISFWGACAGRGWLSMLPIGIVSCIAVVIGSRASAHMGYGRAPGVFESASQVQLLWLIVPAALLALAQSYWLFRVQPSSRLVFLTHYVAPLAIVLFLSGFAVQTLSS